MVEKTQSEFYSLKHDIAGELHIGSGETNTIKSVASLIKEIRYNHHNIIFNMYSGIHEDVVERIDNGLLDFGIVMLYEVEKAPAPAAML